MSQPKWRFVANLGDAHPLDYGGYFVYRDTMGVYVEEAEILIPPEEGETKYRVHRFVLERCTFVNGILSDNKFHPEHPAWFASPDTGRAERPQDTTYLSNLADFIDVEVDELQRLFCSENPLHRAQAYRVVGQYHGWDNLDDNPLELTRSEARKRYRGHC